MTPPTTASVRDAAEECVKRGHILPHQLAAWSALDRSLTPAQRQQFTLYWRAQGSPAAPPPQRTNPLTGFPWFPQLDNPGGQGYRECQTSAIAMCLAYLKFGGIKADEDYQRVVNQFGDTTSQEAHRKALYSLGVEARFVRNCSATEARDEIRAGRPLAMGILHHGPAQAPTGGGHWIACYGFEGEKDGSWVVNDPYGELDLVSGGWARTGGAAGRGLRYSCANLNRRWLIGGAASGWAWLFG
jgi:hypothetical protein